MTTDKELFTTQLEEFVEAIAGLKELIAASDTSDVTIDGVLRPSFDKVLRLLVEANFSIFTAESYAYDLRLIEDTKSSAETNSAAVMRVMNNLLSNVNVTFNSGVATSKKTIDETFCGWATPFIQAGETFDSVRVFYSSESVGDALRVGIWSADRSTLIRSAFAYTNSAGEATVSFNDAISPEAGLLYLSIEVYDKNSRLKPTEVTGYENVPDTATYPQMYTTTAAAIGASLLSWATVSSGWGWPISFELTNSSSAKSISDFFEEKKVLTYDSVTDVNNIVFSSAPERQVEFSGWGVDMGIPTARFNLVVIPQITRLALIESDKWKKIHLVVKNGDLNTGELLAKAEISVDSESDTLENLEFYLGDYIELSDITTTLSVGYYAENSTGGDAAAGECVGTNDLATQSYYTTNQGTSWGYFNSATIAIQLIDGVNAASSSIYTLSSIVETEEEEATAINTLDPDPDALAVAPRYYALEGLETNIYPINLRAGRSERIFDFDCTGNKFDHLNNRFLCNPLAAEEGSYTLTVKNLNPDTLAVLDSKSAILNVTAQGAVAGAAINYLAIGDSTTNSGWRLKQVADLSTARTSDAQISFIGTRNTRGEDHEGRSGWTLSRYYQPTTTSDAADNPFIENLGDKFSAPYYITSQSKQVPDVVSFTLGINDVFYAQSDTAVHDIADDWLQMLDEIIGVQVASDVGSWKEVSSSIAFLVSLPILPMSQDGFNEVVGTGQSQARYWRNIVIMSHRIIEHYKDSESDKIYLMPFNAQIDIKNNMPQTTAAAVNAHSTNTATHDSNDVHPYDGGGNKQLGDIEFAAINYLKANSII